MRISARNYDEAGHYAKEKGGPLVHLALSREAGKGNNRRASEVLMHTPGSLYSNIPAVICGRKRGFIFRTWFVHIFKELVHIFLAERWHIRTQLTIAQDTGIIPREGRPVGAFAFHERNGKEMETQCLGKGDRQSDGDRDMVRSWK